MVPAMVAVYGSSVLSVDPADPRPHWNTIQPRDTAPEMEPTVEAISAIVMGWGRGVGCGLPNVCRHRVRA